MRSSVTLALAIFASCFISVAAPAQTVVEKAATALRDSSCRSCHGEFGDSPSTTTPRLNGQSAEYLRNRLESFRYPIREAPRTIHNMGHLSPQLTGAVAAALAKFYADQTPPAPGGDANREGAAIYRNGAQDIPSCRVCHGERAEGRGGIPRLIGQHKDYLRIQLQAFGMGARIGDPMNHHVWMMSPEQVEALVAYLGS